MKNDFNFDLKSVPKQLRAYTKSLQRYQVVLFIVAIVGLYGFLVMQISTASQSEPTQSQIDEQLGTVKRLKIDQSSIDKIQQLKDQNVVVQSLFETARENPFQE